MTLSSGARHAGRTAHAAAQRLELIQIAYHLIAEKGFEGLRTRAVAERAGINIATLHYYFATKEDLIRGVVAYMHDIFANLHTPTAEYPYRFIHVPPETRPLYDQPLVEMRNDLADLRCKWQAEPDSYIVMLELIVRSLRDPAIRRIISELEDHWQEYIASYLAKGVADGVFRSDLDIAVAAATLRIFIKGCTLEIMTRDEQFPAERVYAEIERWLTEHAR
jgi:AcrR family transcriptional regulator